MPTSPSIIITPISFQDPKFMSGSLSRFSVLLDLDEATRSHVEKRRLP